MVKTEHLTLGGTSGYILGQHLQTPHAVIWQHSQVLLNKPRYKEICIYILSDLFWVQFSEPTLIYDNLSLCINFLDMPSIQNSLHYRHIYPVTLIKTHTLTEISVGTVD